MKQCDHAHHQHQRNELGRLTSRLREKARKVTGPRQAILELLRHQEHPITTKEILARLSDGECDLATVYRSMHLLESMGLVKRFDFGDGTSRFELVSEGEAGHHHHLICTRCAAVVEIQDCFPRDLEERIASGNGFTAITHKLEFFGICPLCR